MIITLGDALKELMQKLQQKTPQNKKINKNQKTLDNQNQIV